MKTIKYKHISSVHPLPSLHVIHVWDTAATQTHQLKGLWGFFKRTGASLTVMYSSHRLLPFCPAAGDLLVGP